MSSLFDFDKNSGNWESGWEFGGVASCYWSGGSLCMDGAGSWGENYWRVEVPDNVCAVWSLTEFEINWTNAANCFATISVWDKWGYRFWYGSLFGATSPQTKVFSKSGFSGKVNVKWIGVQNNINGAGYKLNDFEVRGLYACDYPGPGYGPEYDLLESKLYFSNTQFGSRLGSGIYVSGVDLDDESLGIIQTSNVRLG